MSPHTHYLAFHTVRLHCQTPTIMPMFQAVRQFVHSYDGVWYDPAWREPQPTT